MNVAILESSKTIRYLLKDFFECNGIDVFCFDNPEDLLYFLDSTEKQPDVLISDLLRDKETCIINTIEEIILTKIKIIISSGFDLEYQKRMLGVLADSNHISYMPKPYRLIDMLNCVNGKI